MASRRVATVMATRVHPRTGESFEVDVPVDPPAEEEDSDSDSDDAFSSSYTCAVCGCGDHQRELISMLTRNAEGDPDWWSGVYICRSCDYARSDATEAVLAAEEATRVRIRRFVLYARAVGWFVCRYQAARARVGQQSKRQQSKRQQSKRQRTE